MNKTDKINLNFASFENFQKIFYKRVYFIKSFKQIIKLNHLNNKLFEICIYKVYNH